MTPDLALAGTWAALAATPFVVWSRRHAVAHRLAGPARIRTMQRRRRFELGMVGRVVRGLTRRRAASRVDAVVAATLPAALDVLVAAIGAGCTPTGAVELAARWGPPPIARELARALVTVELGGSLVEALTGLRSETPLLAPLVDVLVASAELGAPATSALVRLGDEARAASRRRAETRARVLPVKLLFPLVFLVLPAFGLLTVAPALISALDRL